MEEKYRIHSSIREEVPKENRKMQCFFQTGSHAQARCQVSQDAWEGKGRRAWWQIVCLLQAYLEVGK